MSLLLTSATHIRKHTHTHYTPQTQHRLSYVVQIGFRRIPAKGGGGGFGRLGFPLLRQTVKYLNRFESSSKCVLHICNGRVNCDGFWLIDDRVIYTLHYFDQDTPETIEEQKNRNGTRDLPNAKNLSRHKTNKIKTVDCTRIYVIGSVMKWHDDTEAK